MTVDAERTVGVGRCAGTLAVSPPLPHFRLHHTSPAWMFQRAERVRWRPHGRRHHVQPPASYPPQDAPENTTRRDRSDEACTWAAEWRGCRLGAATEGAPLQQAGPAGCSADAPAPTALAGHPDCPQPRRPSTVGGTSRLPQPTLLHPTALVGPPCRRPHTAGGTPASPPPTVLKKPLRA